MLLGIWLVSCQWIPGSNHARQGALVYGDRFSRDAINKCGRAFLGFPDKISLDNNQATQQIRNDSPLGQDGLQKNVIEQLKKLNFRTLNHKI